MVSSSDSHKSSQVGLCVTEIKTKDQFTVGDARKILSSVSQEDIDFLIDRNALNKKGRKTYGFQAGPIYQFFLKYVPKRLRRCIKIFFSSLTRNKRLEDPTYTTYKI